MQTRFSLGRGIVDYQAWVSDGSLGFGGWYAAFEPVVAEGLRVLAGDAPMTVLSIERVASPDIAVKFPHLSHASHCRFQVRLQASATVRQPNCLLTIVPRLSSGAEGLPLYAIAGLDLPIPDASAVESIGGGFLPPALDFMRFFVNFAGLQPQHTVLDIGCGIGRMAYPLFAYLGPTGRYIGFDVMRGAIDTARRALGHDARFELVHLDLGNSVYNPHGAADSRSIRFPCDSGSVDLGVMTSVVTHLVPAEVQHYFRELGRCLRPGGRAVVTAFSLTNEALALLEAGRSSQAFKPAKDCWVVDPDFAERSIAFYPHDLAAWFAAGGLRIEQWYAGDWCGRAAGLSYQDIFVVVR